MMTLPPPQIIDHDGFQVLRDDLTEGGTKRRVLTKIISGLKEQEIVYAACLRGYGQLAMGLACNDNNKQATLFYQANPPLTKIFKQSTSKKNVTTHFSKVANTQSDLHLEAQKYAEKNDAYIMPIGFKMSEFESGLTELAKSLPIKPKEVWVLGGSGTLSRALCDAWPDAQINAVSLGLGHANMGRADVYQAPEGKDNPAENPPPYPASSHYDAKVWQFVQKYGTRGPDTLVWNVGG